MRRLSTLTARAICGMVILTVAVMVRLHSPSSAVRAAEDREPSMLIQVRELQSLLTQPGVRILDARPAEEYSQGHVPGAAAVDVKSWQTLGKSEGGFKNAKGWGELVGKLGIERDSTVIVYGGRLPDAARVWWLLKYVGVADVRLLDGGWEAWAKARLPISDAVPDIAATEFEPDFQADRLEEIDSLKQSHKREGVTVVDTRSADEFSGKSAQGGRGGHIPEATHLEWTELLAADGRFKPVDELKALFKVRGILPDDTAVCY